MFILNRFSIYFIILRMCSGKSNPNHLIVVADFYNQPVMIAFDIENNPVVS